MTQLNHPCDGALICIPTYNERENIERIVPAVLAQVPLAHVLIIDDNSPDDTGAIADALAAADQRVHVLHRAQKEGLGRAYIAGFRYALSNGYRFIVEFDADFSHNPKYLPELLEHLEHHDLVIGSRRVPGGGVKNWGAGRRLISYGGSLYARVILGAGVKDLTGGFNGFKASALELLDLESIAASGFGFQIEVKYRASRLGLSIKEFPIVFEDRDAGTSKMSKSIFLEAMLGVLRLRFGADADSKAPNGK